jgi:hypothetical protein
VAIYTAGTTSQVRRGYFYQRPEFDVIQEHQWWRVERAHGITAPGCVVGIAYNPYYAHIDGHLYSADRVTKIPCLDRPLDDAGTHVGPVLRNQAVGSHNTYREWTYSRYTDEKGWRAGWSRIRGLMPKAVLMAPSQVQAAWPAVRDMRPLPCPVVTTGEVLDGATREMAAQLFSGVVDKMRCWDGGMGFAECASGRKHVLDELALVEDLAGVLVSTDLFNYCHPFLRYANGDDGTVVLDGCECGVYGLQFAEFRGRRVQRLMIGGRAVPGTAIAEELTNFLFLGGLPAMRVCEAFRARHGPAHILGDRPIRWQLRQDAAGDFEFLYDGELTAAQLAYLEEGVRFVVLREGDLPLGPADLRPSGHSLRFTRRPALGDSLKHLYVVSEV